MDSVSELSRKLARWCALYKVYTQTLIIIIYAHCAAVVEWHLSYKEYLVLIQNGCFIKDF